MRDRINGMRELLVKTLKAKGVPGDYSFITRQRGMFSFSGLTPQQVEALKQKYAIYIVGSGRINVAGITEQNVGPLCEAIAEVVKSVVALRLTHGRAHHLRGRRLPPARRRHSRGHRLADRARPTLGRAGAERLGQDDAAADRVRLSVADERPRAAAWARS